jgi:peptidoglycan/xylan/chitin deacetylase (PgdA/CDA1 family)
MGQNSRSLNLIAALAALLVVVVAAWIILPRLGDAQVEAEREPRVFPELVGREVVILDDEANRAYWGDSGAELPPRVVQWRDALLRIGMNVRTIPAIDDWDDEFLVLPHSYCLSSGDVQLIHQEIESGKGVLFVGPVGVRDSDGSWISWNRFHSIVGSTDLREFSGLETMFLVVSGNGSVGSLPMAGHRISLLQREGQWGIAGLPGGAYWADYDRNAFPTDEVFHAAAIGTRGSGRFTWVGFDPDLAAGSYDSQDAFDQFVADLVAWSLSLPAAEVDLYPDGKPNALVVAMDTEWQFENAVHLGELLQARGLRGGFMCVNEFAEPNAGLVRSLAEFHDIGSHSEDHTVFVGQPRRTQAMRLRQSAAGLNELSGQPILGFRPPEERYDENTLEALVKTGFSYILGGEATAVGLPVLLHGSEADSSAPLVLIPRIQRDDLYLVNRERLSDAELADGWRSDWETVRRHRGIHYVSVHSTWLTSSDKAKLLGDFLDTVPLNEIWVPGPNDLAEWWHTRSMIETELEGGKDGPVRLIVRNRGSERVSEVGIWAEFEGNPRSVRLLDDDAWVTGPDERGAYFFLIEELLPRDSLRIQVHLVGR